MRPHPRHETPINKQALNSSWEASQMLPLGPSMVHARSLTECLCFTWTCTLYRWEDRGLERLTSYSWSMGNWIWELGFVPLSKSMFFLCPWCSQKGRLISSTFSTVSTSSCCVCLGVEWKKANYTTEVCPLQPTLSIPGVLCVSLLCAVHRARSPTSGLKKDHSKKKPCNSLSIKSHAEKSSIVYPFFFPLEVYFHQRRNLGDRHKPNQICCLLPLNDLQHLTYSLLRHCFLVKKAETTCFF